MDIEINDMKNSKGTKLLDLKFKEYRHSDVFCDVNLTKDMKNMIAFVYLSMNQLDWENPTLIPIYKLKLEDFHLYLSGINEKLSSSLIRMAEGLSNIYVQFGQDDLVPLFTRFGRQNEYLIVKPNTEIREEFVLLTSKIDRHQEIDRISINFL